MRLVYVRVDVLTDEFQIKLQRAPGSRLAAAPASATGNFDLMCQMKANPAGPGNPVCGGLLAFWGAIQGHFYQHRVFAAKKMR